jgi:tetratricopeptide (TPR) repeat protein
MGPRPRTYRLYDSPASIRLLLTIVNESTTAIEFDHATLRREFRLVLDGRVGLYATWAPDMASSTGRVALNLDREVRLGAGNAAGWAIDVRRSDGKPFGAGVHVITATMNNAFDSLRSPEGHPLHTASARDTSLTLHLGAPSGPRERADDFRSRAERIKTTNPGEAIRLLHAAQAFDPANLRILLALGQAYVAVERYKESLPFFERALAMQTNTHRSSIPYSLAFVYVALGNEAEARRVLRAGGVSDEGVERSLMNYRRKLGQR